MRRYRNNRQMYSRRPGMRRPVHERFYSRRRLNESQMWAEGEDSIPGGENWELCELDVWTEADPDYDEEGVSYMVNDVFPTGKIFCTSPSAREKDIENLVKSIYRFNRNIDLRVNWDDYNIFVDADDTGEPICQFRIPN